MALCQQYVAAVRRVGADGLLPLMLCLLSNTAYFVSDFATMEMSAAEALRLAESTGQGPVAGFARACLAMVLAVRGDMRTASEHLAAARAGIADTSIKAIWGLTGVAEAMAAMGADDWRAAVAAFDSLRAVFTDQLPSGILHFRADEAEALWRCGRHDDARGALAALEVTIAGEGPWERAGAERVAALLAQADGAEAHFTRALELHRSSPAAFELARTEWCFGEWLIGQGRVTEALERLTSARREFDRLGAAPWAQRVARLQQALAEASPEGADVLDPSTSGAVELKALGPFRIVRSSGEQRVGADTAGRLLCYLVTTAGHAHVEQITDALWPDADVEQGAARLRTVLSRVRARYGPLVVRDGRLVRWHPTVMVDADRFGLLARKALAGARDSAEVGQWAAEAVALYEGDLLPAERYADWVVPLRERLRRDYLLLLELLTDSATRSGDPDAAIEYARRRLDADPHDDDAYVQLARLLLGAGRIRQAEQVIQSARAAAEELGLPPSAALEEIAARLHD
jgi:DNA-binding SARP family transcriptional activator